MWQYEQRNPVLSQRELELGDQVSTGRMSQRFAACRELLSHDHNNRQLLQRCRNCGDRYPCQIKYCDKCYDRPLDPSNWHVDPSRFIAEDVVNPIIYSQHVGHGAYRHVQRVQRMMEPFYGLPLNEIAPFTAKFCYLQGGEDYVAVKNFYHRWMREIAVGFRDLVHPDVKFVYRFEWSWTTAGDAAWKLPMRAPGVVDVERMDPNQVVIIFHCHGAAHFPGFTYSEAGQFFRMVFDGPSQVHIATPRPDRMIDVGGNDPALINVVEPSFTKDHHYVLQDHPNDALDCFDIGLSCHGLAPSIDQRLDALAAAFHLEDDVDYKQDAGDLVRTSGLAGFFNYACKEHLPKAESRYRRLAGEMSTDSTAGDRERGSGKKLSPEQMVIACHGDAELKRAFHRQRLAHTFGTVKKSKPKTDNLVQPTQPDVADPDRSTDKVELNGDGAASQLGWTTAIASLCKTAVARCVGLSSKSYRFWQFSEYNIPQTEAAQAHNNKEGGRSISAKPFFSWSRSILNFTLRLGMRLLRPP